MLFLSAHSAMGIVSCGSVCDTRTMYGEPLVIAEVAAFMMTIGFFASADSGAVASAFGVSPKPASMSGRRRARRLQGLCRKSRHWRFAAATDAGAAQRGA